MVIIAKLEQNSVGVKSLLEIVFVFLRKRVKKAHNNLITLFGQNLLHLLLLRREHLTFIFSIIIMVFSVRAVRVVHGHAS